MNDRRLEELVQMAVEAESLDAWAHGDESSIGDGPLPFMPAVKRGRAFWTTGALAAAACLGLAAVGAWQLWGQIGLAKRSIAALGSESPAEKPASTMVTSIIPVPQSPAPQIIRNVPLRRIVAMAATPEQECGVVVLIVHDLRGLSRCVQIRHEDWDGRCPADLSRFELTAPNMGRACMHGSKQMLVVALSGPAGKLPTSDRGAEELAACILGMPRSCDADGACYNGAAATCLPRDVNFKVETVAVR